MGDANLYPYVLNTMTGVKEKEKILMHLNQRPHMHKLTVSKVEETRAFIPMENTKNILGAAGSDSSNLSRSFSGLHQRSDYITHGR